MTTKTPRASTNIVIVEEFFIDKKEEEKKKEKFSDLSAFKTWGNAELHLYSYGNEFQNDWIFNWFFIVGILACEAFKSVDVAFKITLKSL